MTLAKGTPSIIRGSDYMFSTTYEGNGGGQKVGKFIPFTDNGTIAKSARFENGGPAYLSKTYGSSGTSLKKFTFSCWFKLGRDSIAGTSGYYPTLFNVGGESGKYFSLFYQSVNQLFQYYSYNSTYDLRGITVRTFEDISKWYHIVIAIDTTESTAGDRVKFYIDGDRITNFTNQVNPAQDYDLAVGAAEPYYVGYMNSGDTWDGYIAEANYVDGTALTPSTFGLTDTSTGRWIPKSLTGISYGSNGFRMEFANSAGQTIGDDTSGNGNDFTVNNMNTDDIVLDSPTNNFMTFTPNGQVGSNSLSEGNLKPTFPSGTGASAIPSTFRIPVGKWYFEYYIPGTNSVLIMMAVAPENTSFSGRMHTLSGFKTIYPYTRTIYEGSSSLLDESDMPLAEDDTTVGVYIERKTDGTVNYWFGDDQASKGTFAYSYSGNPATGANPVASKFRSDENLKLFTGSDGNGNYSSGVRGVFNFGQLKESPIDSGTALTDYTSTAGGFFRYQPADGFKALSQDNLPESTKQGISDLVWIKNRDSTDAHQLYDSSRGVKQKLTTVAGAESTVEDGLQKFLKGGFAVEDDVSVNTSGESYVAWNWVANGGTTAANTDGSGASIASTTQANQTAGFSIVTYTGTGSAGTIAHGLSSAPEWVMASRRNDSSGDGWTTYHTGMTNANYWMDTRLTNAQNSASTVWNGTAPTNKVFSVGTATGTNTSSKTYVAYCWHSVSGFSKFGAYTGNGSTNGPFVNTGFKPSWLIVKNSAASTNWVVWDNNRTPINEMNTALLPNGTNTDTSGFDIDFLSNGFKLRDSESTLNGSGNRIIYMAFAEHPFLGNGTNPVTAR